MIDNEKSATNERMAAYKSNAMLSRLLRVFRERIVSEGITPSLRAVPDWSMSWDVTDPDLAHRAEIWDLMCYYASDVFPARVKWLYDTELEFAAPSELGRTLFVDGTFDPNEFVFLDAILEPGMTFVDIGANVGVYSIFASRKVGPSGRVIAFEPSLREVQALLRNLAINRISNVTTNTLAVSAESGYAQLSVASQQYNGHNSLGDLTLISTMPTLRFSTDRVNYHYCGLNPGTTAIPLGAAHNLEVLLYSEQPFKYRLKSVHIKGEGSAEPWSVPIEGETPLALPGSMVDDFSHVDLQTVGDLDVEFGDGLQLSGQGGGVGLVLRAALEGAGEYVLELQGGGVPDECVDQYAVETVSLDDYFGDDENTRVDVLKIDVEGADLDALLGARRLIESKQPLVIVEVVNQQMTVEALTQMKELFSTYNYVLFDLRSGAPQLIDLLGEHGSNVVAVPQAHLAKVMALGNIDASALNDAGIA